MDGLTPIPNTIVPIIAVNTFTFPLLRASITAARELRHHCSLVKTARRGDMNKNAMTISMPIMVASVVSSEPRGYLNYYPKRW